MAIYKILVGSYTDSIHTLEFDTSDGTPKLKYLSSVNVGHHPSWIEGHPSDRSLIFTGLEQSDGKIVVVKYDEHGKGQKVDGATCSSGGADPCTLLVTENELIVGNYSGGTIATLPISTSAPYTHPDKLWTLALPFEAGKPGRDLSRQEASHPHQTVFNSLNTTEQELLVTDLGSDKVWRLTKGADGHWATRDFVTTEIGSGPRHVATYGAYMVHTLSLLAQLTMVHNQGNTLYILLELTSELAVYKFRPLTHLTTLSTVTVLPLPSQMKAAEILLPRPNQSFPTAYIYVSNREDPHPEGDTIVIFSLEKGEERPELVSEVRTGLRHVRGMAFGGEDDRWLVVGGAGIQADSSEGAGIKVYERVEGGRGLREIAELDSAIGSILRATDFLWL